MELSKDVLQIYRDSISKSLLAERKERMNEMKDITVRWIPVNERLPEMAAQHGRYGLMSTKVLIAQGVNDKQITFGWLRGNEWVTADMIPFARQELITHWMPLPPAPLKA